MDHPVAMTLPAAAFGMLARLALHFHATECRPLPIADHELMHVARAHAPTWRRWKARVLETFEAIRPEIEGYRTHSLARRQGLIVASNLAVAARRQAKIAQAEAAPATSAPPYAMGFLPRRESPKPSRPGNTLGRRLTD